MKATRVIEKKDLAAAIKRNPPEYQAEVESLSVGKDEQGRLILPVASFNQLRAKYARYRNPPWAGDDFPDARQKAAPKPPTALQLADADRRAAVCRTCDKVKLRNGQPDIRLTIKGFPVHTVGCQDCGCQALSLIHGKCPLGKWPAPTPVSLSKEKP